VVKIATAVRELVQMIGEKTAAAELQVV